MDDATTLFSSPPHLHSLRPSLLRCGPKGGGVLSVSRLTSRFSYASPFYSYSLHFRPHGKRRRPWNPEKQKRRRGKRSSRERVLSSAGGGAPTVWENKIFFILPSRRGLEKRNTAQRKSPFILPSAQGPTTTTSNKIGERREEKRRKEEGGRVRSAGGERNLSPLNQKRKERANISAERGK